VSNAVEEFLQTLKRTLNGDPYPVRSPLKYAPVRYRVASVRDPLQGAVLSCKYRIESRIGKGAMSSVYKATQEPIGRVVALKVLNREFSQDPVNVKRFNREAKIVSALRHRNILSIHDVGNTESGQPFFVMEFLDGVSLETMLEKRGAMAIARALPLFCQVCDGMSYAHSKGLIHRDLKPANIMLVKEEDGSELVKLVDFGIVKLTNSQTASQRLTKKGEIWGSPIYMAPEQCMGNELDARTDIYSFGLVMYEVLLGVPAFQGGAAIGVIVSRQIGQMPAPFNVAAPSLHIPESLEQIVFKAIQKKPDDRFSSMDEMREQLNLFTRQYHIKVPKSTVARAKPHLEKPVQPQSAQTATGCEPVDGSRTTRDSYVDPGSSSATTVSLSRGLPTGQLKMVIICGLALVAIVILLSVTILYFSLNTKSVTHLPNTQPVKTGAVHSSPASQLSTPSKTQESSGAKPEDQHKPVPGSGHSQPRLKKTRSSHQQKTISSTPDRVDDEELLERIHLKKHHGDTTQQWMEIQQKEQNQ